MRETSEKRVVINVEKLLLLKEKEKCYKVYNKK